MILAAAIWSLAAGAGPADEASASIGGNRLVAAGEVHLDEDVGGSAFLAGGRVHLDSEVARSAWVAGGDVRVEGRVGGDLRAAGGNVRVGRDAIISGDAALAGGSLEFEGVVRGNLRAYGESIQINGTVDGDLYVAGDRVRVGPEARISGELRYRGSQDIEIDPGAEVVGGIERQRRSRGNWAERFGDRREAGGRPLLAGALLCGVLLILIAPQFSRAAAARLGSEPLMAGFVGLLVLVGLPVAALLSILTIIGVPLGLLLLFSLLLLLMLGMATAALFLGDAALARMSPARAGAAGWRLLLLLLALLLFWVVAQLPAIGRLAVFLLLLAGTGAFARQSLGMAVGGSRAEPQPRP